MKLDSKIYIAGHRGLVWSAIKRTLEAQWYTNLLCKTHQELDLTDAQQVKHFFEQEKPEYVFLAAAKVGGILANSVYPADFIYQNLQIQNNVIHSAYQSWVKKLLFLGSSCIYPKLCPQPIKEEYLMTGPLETSNDPYALAKITGIKMCQSYNRQYGTQFFACMPTNLYGPNDNFDLNNSHVLPAMLRKFHEAKKEGKSEVVVWGDGSPMREFLYVDDMAQACVFLMDAYTPTQEDNQSGQIYFNIGTGKDITIKDLALTIKKITGYEGEIVWDTSKPNGTPRKLLDVSKIATLGWRYSVDLEQGIAKTYEWFLDTIA